MAEWPTLALFWYAPHASGSVADPIFGRPLNFFLFTLPAWQLINNWLLTLSITTCAVAVLFLFITSGSRTLEQGRIRYGASPWRALSLTAAFLLLILAMTVYVDRFRRSLEHHTIFDGINYTDAHVMLTGLLIVSGALIIGAGIAVVNAMRQSHGRWLVAAALPAALCYGVLGIGGWYVDNFVVQT